MCWGKEGRRRERTFPCSPHTRLRGLGVSLVSLGPLPLSRACTLVPQFPHPDRGADSIDASFHSSLKLCLVCVNRDAGGPDLAIINLSHWSWEQNIYLSSTIPSLPSVGVLTGEVPGTGLGHSLPAL